MGIQVVHATAVAGVWGAQKQFRAILVPVPPLPGLHLGQPQEFYCSVEILQVSSLVTELETPTAQQYQLHFDPDIEQHM